MPKPLISLNSLFKIGREWVESDPLPILSEMLRVYRSLNHARSVFDGFVRIEPRLEPLWDLCQRASPPNRAPVEDVFDDDPYEQDPIAADNANDGWCAEDYFFEHVKSKLFVLVGLYRPSGPSELRSSQAYEEVYDLLLNWALRRSCTCCAESDTGRSGASLEMYAPQ